MSNDHADIRIEQGSVDANGLASPNIARRFSQLAHNTLWFEVPDIARFLVSNGQSVRFEVLPGADAHSITLFLLGTCLGALMHQRGLLVLHANAIQVGTGSVLFAGPSGIGKSTLAAALQQRGYTVVTDDMAVINHHGQILPGYPQIKLWQDSANHLGISTQNLTRIRPELRKFGVPSTQHVINDVLPVTSVYMLAADHLESYRFEALNGFAKFEALGNHTYRQAQLEGMGLQSAHLEQCGSLARQVSAYQLTRPNHNFNAHQLVDHIEAHWRQTGLLP